METEVFNVSKLLSAITLSVANFEKTPLNTISTRPPLRYQDIIYVDAILNVLASIDVETLRSLYTYSIQFRKLINEEKVLNHLKIFYSIVSPITTFPEFYCQHNIKWEQTSKIFMEDVIVNTFIRNDDIETLTLYDKVEQFKLYILENSIDKKS